MGRVLAVLLLVLVVVAVVEDALVGASLVPAVFVFGDSTLDTGNLNYRPNTVQFIRTQELPYGRDFVPPGPTGRASNGKLPPDFLANFLGLPSPIDDLEPDAEGQKLLHGLNFAAGGSGLLNGTGLTTISLFHQLEAFRVSVGRLDQLLGPSGASELLAKSLFLIGSGNNDLFSYVYNPRVRFAYTPNAFNQLLLGSQARDIQTLYGMGARVFVVLSVGPLGCTPLLLNLFDSDGSCLQQVNQQVRDYNAGLQSMLADLQARLPGSKLIYANSFDVLYAAIQNPSRYGFKTGNVACCGGGKFRGSILKLCSKQSEVCSNADEHVFWDVVHPTQAMYKLVTRELFNKLIKFL